MTAFMYELVGRLFSRSSRHAWLYALAALPVGTITFSLAVTALTTGASLVIVWVGLPILWWTFAGARWWAGIERTWLRRSLGVVIAEPINDWSSEGTLARRFMARMRSAVTWRAIGWALLRLPLGIVAVIAAALPIYGVSYLLSPLFGLLVDASASVRVAAMVGGLALILVTPHAVDGVARLHALAARALLGPTKASQLAAATERTARAEAQTDLARDLHDSVGHSLTAALMQASAARRMIDQDPAYAAKALESIEEQGRAALEELDRVLAVIRDERRATQQRFGLDLVDELVTRVRGTGQPVSLSRLGHLNRVPANVGSEAYRVLQEALTNTMRHAAGAPTDVTIDAGEDQLIITVNNASGRKAVDRPTGGRGLIGIAERIAALGGAVTTGPTPDGGFQVHAVIPYGTQPHE